MFVNILNHRVSGLCVGMAMVLLAGCASFPWKPMNVKGPFLEESLMGESQKGQNRYGSFTEQGWQPGPEGSLTFSMPGMTQGVIAFDVTGLNRSVEDTVILTMYEELPADYIEPYVIHNPYKVLVSMTNYQESPRSPFSFLWTAKTFVAGTSEDTIYSETMPENAYQSEVDSRQAAIFLNETYRVKLEWANGVAIMSLNDEVLARHEYRPTIYNPSSLKVILGKTPEASTFSLPELNYSNLVITFPELQ